jgi:hypothetical protein
MYRLFRETIGFLCLSPLELLECDILLDLQGDTVPF